MCGCWSHHSKGAPCNCACHTRLQGRVVEPEFAVGQQVSGDDYERLPVGARVADADGGTAAFIKRSDPNTWVWAGSGEPKIVPPHLKRTLTHLPATEPEDKDDLYVEPEPLKEGDWCLVWVKVARAEPDDDGDLLFEAHSGSVVYEHPDAIVRPDAGDLPPWLTQPEVEEPLGLGAVVEAGRPEFVERSQFVRRHPQGVQPWQSPGNSHYAWSDLKDPKVLSEGWNEGEK